MKKFTNFISRKASFALSIGLAVLMAGLVSATVLAAIPSSNGTIHGCYRNSGGLLNAKGSLRVINTDNGESCTSQETALNWNAGGSGGSNLEVYDENGQALGTLFAQGQVYNPSVNRIIPISSNGNGGVNVGEQTSLYFASTDCTGQPYIDGNGIDDVKTTLQTWTALGASTPSYGIVANNASPVTLPASSAVVFNSSTGQAYCSSFSDAPETNPGFFPSTTVPAPYSSPVVEPIHF